MIPKQKSFLDFAKERFGPNPDSVVITPKQQHELRRDYRTLWGPADDRQAWAALYALREIVAAYRDDCADAEQPASIQAALEAIELLTT